MLTYWHLTSDMITLFRKKVNKLHRQWLWIFKLNWTKWFMVSFFISNNSARKQISILPNTSNYSFNLQTAPVELFSGQQMWMWLYWTGQLPGVNVCLTCECEQSVPEKTFSDTSVVKRRVKTCHSVFWGVHLPHPWGNGSDTCLGLSVQTLLGNSLESPRRLVPHIHPKVTSNHLECEYFLHYNAPKIHILWGIQPWWQANIWKPLKISCTCMSLSERLCFTVNFINSQHLSHWEPSTAHTGFPQPLQSGWSSSCGSSTPLSR